MENTCGELELVHVNVNVPYLSKSKEGYETKRKRIEGRLQVAVRYENDECPLTGSEFQSCESCFR